MEDLLDMLFGAENIRTSMIQYFMESHGLFLGDSFRIRKKGDKKDFVEGTFTIRKVRNKNTENSSKDEQEKAKNTDYSNIRFIHTYREYLDDDDNDSDKRSGFYQEHSYDETDLVLKKASSPDSIYEVVVKDRWYPSSYGEEYYWISLRRKEVRKKTWREDNLDLMLYLSENIFKTREEAEKHMSSYEKELRRLFLEKKE